MDALTLYGEHFSSRLLIGSALYPSPQIMLDAIAQSQAQWVTLSWQRQQPSSRQGDSFWQLIRSSGCHVLPNTAGCYRAEQAVTLAQMARELFDTPWIKLEVIGDQYSLQPDPFELVKAAKQLIDQGFKVLPYCTEDLILCQRLIDVGCEVLMPWGAPIGTGQGLLNPYHLSALRQRLQGVTLIIDAGIGRPSQAMQAMEMGFDGILLNTAIAKAVDPVNMARAFCQAVQAGRLAFASGVMPKRQTAVPSTPLTDVPFWQQDGFEV